MQEVAMLQAMIAAEALSRGDAGGLGIAYALAKCACLGYQAMNDQSEAVD